MKVEDIRISNIKQVANTRQYLAKSDVAGLMESIKQNGLLEPIGVVKKGTGFEIAYGNRRFEACKKLGYTTIPSVVITEDVTEQDFLIMNITENLHREDISVSELGRVCNKLRETMSISEIASKLSIAISRVKLALKIYETIPKEIRKDIQVFQNRRTLKGRDGKVPLNIASQLTGTKLSTDAKIKVFEHIRKEDLTYLDSKMLVSLVEGGVNLSKAVSQVKLYRSQSVNILIKKDVLDSIVKEHGSLRSFFIDCINEKYPDSALSSGFFKA